VSLAAVTWDFALVGRTRMLTQAWRRAGLPTTFVQVPSWRTALQRVTQAVRGRPDGPVVRPWPVRPSRWWDVDDEAGLRRAIRQRARGLRKQLEARIDFSAAAALVVSPVWTPWLDELPFRCIIYDCIDDLAVHVPRPHLAGLYARWEAELVQRAAGAAVTASPLAAHLRARRPELPVATIRNGVDAAFFERAARASPRPADLPARGRPIVGFVGALYAWIDWELIERVAGTLSGCDFVFVGPHHGRGSVRRVARLKNVLFLGARRYERVPAYVQAFDVCWVPFDRSGVSQAANPVKIYEYLALGKPVVATPVADTAAFEGLVRVGRDADEIAGHLRAALAEGEQGAERRVGFARANSWDARAAQYASFIAALAR